MSNGTSSGSSSRPRWWEDYLVRYFTGTLVGTFCVFVLVTDIFFPGGLSEPAKGLFSSSDKEPTWLRLIALVLTGGAYCYLASVPITVFHAGRMVRTGMNRVARKAWYIWWALAFIAALLSTLSATGLLACISTNTATKLIFAIGIAPIVWLFFGQVEVLIRLKLDQDLPAEKSVFRTFYRALVRARHATADTGIRDSYTHLREHANSVFIVVIELSLLATLLAVHKAIPDREQFALWSLAFLLLWTSPNILLWGLANSLERDLSENRAEYERPPSS